MSVGSGDFKSFADRGLTRDYRHTSYKRRNLDLKQAYTETDLLRIHPRVAATTAIQSGDPVAAGLSPKL